MNKRCAVGEEPLFEQIIFIILNVLFIAVLMTFVSSASDGTGVYEQSYSKQIALLIDQAKADTNIIVNMEKAVEIANKKSWQRDKIVQIDELGKQIIVRLAPNGGYVMHYFSGYNVSIKGDLNNSDVLVLEVKDAN